MSQHWHGHWTESTFAPKKLRNWEISKWYPNWPVRHCIATQFIADDNGHILNSTTKAKYSPWGTYKGAWDLPKKITRSIAEALSATPQYKKDAWKLYTKKHNNLCKEMDRVKMKQIKKNNDLTKGKIKKTHEHNQMNKIQKSCTFEKNDEMQKIKKNTRT